MRGEVKMQPSRELEERIRKNVNEEEMKKAEVEVLLSLNKRLFERGLIPEKMFRMANDEILRAG